MVEQMTKFKSSRNPMFRSKFSEDIFNLKYSHDLCESYGQLAKTLVHDVCGSFRSDKNMPEVREAALMSPTELDQLVEYVADLKFVPGGRYLYYAGRKKRFYISHGRMSPASWLGEGSGMTTACTGLRTLL